MSADNVQPALFGRPPSDWPAGRVELAVQESITDARFPAAYAGAAMLAVELARAVDVAARRADPWAVAQAGRDLSAHLARLLLDPASREDGPGDKLDELLRELSTPTTGDRVEP